MESTLTMDMQQQIEEASKKAKPKKAMYLYDETGNRELLGVFSQKKADQIRRSGAKYLVAPCANCKKQLRELVEDQEIDCEVVGLHDLLYKAIIFDESLKVEPAADETESSEEI